MPEQVGSLEVPVHSASVAGSPLLRVTDLEAGYWDLPVLRNVHVSVADGAFVSVIGPNGSGKSTLLKAIYGLVKVTSGEILVTVDERVHRLRNLQPFQITTIGLNYLPQLSSVFVDMSVAENLEIGGILSRATVDEALDRVFDLFPALKRIRSKRAGTLSGGQQRMLGIGRALMTSPNLLLLDEPSAGLAPNLVDDLFDQIVEVNKSGVAILMVEQNARRALDLSDYAYVLDVGRNSLEGPGHQLVDDPRVVELYLGGARAYQSSDRVEMPPQSSRPSL